MKQTALLCMLLINASQISSSYAKKFEQTAFRNRHRHTQHTGSTFFTTIKFDKATEEARAAQERISPASTARSFSPKKSKASL